MAVNSLSSTTRLMGMNSGLDTESIIQQTMKLAQMKIDKQNRAKTLIEWKQKQFNTVKNDITSFRRTFLSSLSAQNMRTSSVYNTNVAVLSGKNSSAVSVSTSYSSSTGTVKIGQVVSLAKNSNVSVSNASADGKGFSTSDTLGSLAFKGGEFAFKDTVVPPPEAPTESQFMVKTTNEAGEEVEVLDQEAFDLAYAEHERFMAEDYQEVHEQRLNFTINGKEFSFKDTDTLAHMMSTINADKDAGVTMSYDRLSDKFTIEAKESGADKKVELGGEGNPMGVFGFGEASAGTKAQVYVNGELITSDTNTFDYRGIKITLNNTTTTGGREVDGKYVESEDDTTVTVKRDATNALNTIKGFIDSYNTLIKKLESMLKERKSSTETKYTPLTDEEKSAMTEKQIEEWETIAKKGLLRNDAGIQNMVSSLRGALFDAVESAGLSASSIGLSTGSFFDGTGGQIVLNEDKLRAALEKDPEQVMSIFTNVSKADPKTDPKTYYKESGLLNRMDKIMGDYVSVTGSNGRSLDSLERSLKQTNDQISKLEIKMYKEQEALYKKFAAMETALSKIQSQGDYFTSMLGG